MATADLFYVNTEQELTQWSLAHSSYTDPYSIRVFEHYGKDDEMIFEFILWLKHMRRTFPEHVRVEGLNEYIANVFVVAHNEHPQ